MKLHCWDDRGFDWDFDLNDMSSTSGSAAISAATIQCVLAFWAQSATLQFTNWLAHCIAFFAIACNTQASVWHSCRLHVSFSDLQPVQL